MSTYYEFDGALTFSSREEAAEVLAQFRGLDFFWTPRPEKAKDLVVSGATLTFAFKGFGGKYEEFIDARILLAEVVEKALAGRVRVQAGDGDPGTELEYFGFKPAAAKKTAAPEKKATTKK